MFGLTRQDIINDDLGALNEVGVVDQNGAALAAGDVLGFVKALGGHSAEGAQVFAFVLAKQAVGVIFDDGDAVATGDGADRIHLTADPGVMNADDGARARGNESLQLGLIQVEGIGANVDKYRPGAA